ncbi:FAD binding domain-containing protein [Nocardioides sp. LHG3406-4]|uniref:FAD binding domain-containing protein n=1 Tax=Nocardioides sp. LHG3406-4 TaxID=2804575 RepID=UPI003CEB2A52
MSGPGYARPGSVADTVATLQSHPGARMIAGGTDLMVQMRLGHRSPELLVGTGALDELHRLEAGADDTHIGSAVTLREFLQVRELVARHPALAQAAHLLGGRQIQAVATFGGNICNASPAAESTTPLLVYDAQAEIAGPQGRREIPLAELFEGPGRTTLGPGELLVALRLPGVGGDQRSAYRRMELRRSVDIAIVSASAWFQVVDGRVAEARVAIGAVNAVATRVPDAEEALTGVDVSDRSAVATAIAEAASSCRQASRPIDDTRASARYRAAMVEVISQRTMAEAIDQENS